MESVYRDLAGDGRDAFVQEKLKAAVKSDDVKNHYYGSTARNNNQKVLDEFDFKPFKPDSPSAKFLDVRAALAASVKPETATSTKLLKRPCEAPSCDEAKMEEQQYAKEVLEIIVRWSLGHWFVAVRRVSKIGLIHLQVTNDL